MTCGNCPYTDGLCYTSLPPQVRCNITGEYHYYGDECNCKDDLAAGKAEELEKLKEMLKQPGALMMAVNYDSDKAPAVAITGEEAALAYESLLNLPRYGECKYINNDKISTIKPITSPIDLNEYDKRLLEPVYMYATECLVCGIEVPVSFLGGGPMICPGCKKAIKFIREKFKEAIENYEV